jgi:hypothetical protein
MFFNSAACNAIPYGPERVAYMDARKASGETVTTHIVTVAFDDLDAKGRQHGYRVVYGTKTLARDANGTWLVEDEALGLWYTACPHALKDGKPWGAIQSNKSFRTPAEASAAGAAMIERARKAASKKK